MAHRPRIKYRPAQKADIWDRWQGGESMCSFLSQSVNRGLTPNIRFISPTYVDATTRAFLIISRASS